MMFSKIKALWLRWTQKTEVPARQRYLALLHYNGQAAVRSDELSNTVFAFFRELNIEDVAHYQTRDLMSMEVELHHAHMGYLLSAMEFANAYIAQDDELALRHMHAQEHNRLHSMYLDHYFVDAEHVPLNIAASLRRLKTLLEEQERLLAGLDHSLYARLLGRLYEDIRTLMYRLVVELEDTAM